ncbi:MAG: hypothetical protein L0Z55_12305 [Planctomycetes bacterium]|nr:hypothetical protein [Planctomycetota bacterium]
MATHRAPRRPLQPSLRREAFRPRAAARRAPSRARHCLGPRRGIALRCRDRRRGSRGRHCRDPLGRRRAQGRHRGEVALPQR